MLTQGPILALNLLKVDDSFEGPDQVNYTTLSLNAAVKNPKVVSAGKVYGEYDYLAETIDNVLYNTVKGDPIPFVGKTPYSSLFDRSRFWKPSDHNLMRVAANGLVTNDDTTFEKTNLLNFGNTGTDEISILVFKPENIKSYDITAKEWWGGNENIPYGWIRPSDYISDYFIRVVAVKGNWTNYPVLASDPIWGKYFDKKGILKNKINQFVSAEGITFIGSWTGVIIPDFIDKQGNYLYIEDKVNAQTETTGVLMAVNKDALQVISYDLNGIDTTTGEETGVGSWIYDYDENHEAESDMGENEINTETGYIVDMVGHGLQKGIQTNTNWTELTSHSELKVPAYYFYNSFETPDASWVCLNTNGLDTTTPVDDVQTKAKIQVITSHAYGTDGKPSTSLDDLLVGDKAKQSYVYAVYDASTGKRIKGIYSYVVTNEDYFKTANNSENPSKSDEIKAMIACPSTGSKDASTGTIASVVSGTAAANHAVYLKQEWDKNYNLQDVEIYYGTYALYDGEKFRLYSVYSNKTISKYAEFADLQADITNKNVPNSLNLYDPSTSIKINSVDTSVYSFGVAGNQYAYNPTTKKYYILASTEVNSYFGVNFLSYNYITDNVNDVVYDVYGAKYFNGKKIKPAVGDVEYGVNATIEWQDADIFASEAPVPEDCHNMFMIFDDVEAGYIQLNDYVNNLTFYNNTGDATHYNLIPGITRIIKKVFVNVQSGGEFNYNGKVYKLNPTTTAQCIKTKTGKRGFYLFTAIDPVLISGAHGYITRQLPISNDIISKSLRFIPLKGLHITAKHRPGFDKYGKISLEGGIEKVYSMLEEEGIHKGLCNPNMVDYRYIVDSMSYGLAPELGGKVYLSRLAQDRMKTTAILNLPSKRQFEACNDPIFCDAYDQSQYVKPSFNCKYIPTGGNTDAYGTAMFSLPTEDDGSKFSAAFWPNLLYKVGGKNLSVPPAADVCNTLIRKFQGGDPYAITANRNGVLQNQKLVGIEYQADVTDREYLEPFGVNTIIMEQNRIMIYGNQTCYQDTKSDFNKLHVRENLNTLEIACEAVLKQYNFLYNTPAVRASIVTALTPILEAMKNSQAIERYNIICDETNNTPDLIMESFGIVDIEVWMSHGMEKIVQRITLNRYDTLND